jgi:hypothetical protein
MAAPFVHSQHTDRWVGLTTPAIRHAAIPLAAIAMQGGSFLWSSGSFSL